MLGNLLSINLFSRECVRKFYQALVVRAVIHVVSFVKIHIFPYLKIKKWISDQNLTFPLQNKRHPFQLLHLQHQQVYSIDSMYRYFIDIFSLFSCEKILSYLLFIITTACYSDERCHCNLDCWNPETCDATPVCCPQYECPRGYFKTEQGTCLLPPIGCSE